MERKRMIFGLTVAALVLVVLIAGFGGNKASVAPVVGAHAPSLVGVNLDGKKISLQELEGRRVIITFWQTKSQPSIRELRALTDIKKANEDKVGIITINEGDPKAEVIAFMQEHQFVSDVIIDDSKASLANLYKIDYLPTTFILDRHGIIVKKVNGGMTIKEMFDYLK